MQNSLFLSNTPVNSDNIDSHYVVSPLQLSDAILRQIHLKNHTTASSPDKLQNLAGGLAFHCSVDLKNRRFTEAAAMSTMFRGYESLLPGKDLNKIGRVSATASGICGGVHATASALSLEMALSMPPPPLGIQLRNLLLSCQYLNDNTMHLFVLSGPDYSADVFRNTAPEIWRKALNSSAPARNIHGFAQISDIMEALNKPAGSLYIEALKMVQIARQAYVELGGKYPHSESIIPGGVSIQADHKQVLAYAEKLVPFYDYAKRSIAIWDDLFNFLLDVCPEYQNVGRTPANMLDFGQWDNCRSYNANYKDAHIWGEQRWSTPGAVINGELITTNLHELNCGLEEFVEHSFYEPWSEQTYFSDPAGHPISLHHPWNKRLQPTLDPEKTIYPYSWGSAITWRRNNFEVGAYARLYISALAKKLPVSSHIQSTGSSLQLRLPESVLPAQSVEWKIPPIWNAIERNRARAYALAFNLLVTQDNVDIALELIRNGETLTSVPMNSPTAETCFGVGLWGAGRGFLAHWATLKNGVIDNYQIAIPSRINASPRTPWGALGPLEQAVLNTPILEESAGDPSRFQAIELQRCLQSFDPCMPTRAFILLNGSDEHILERVIDTSFPI